MKKTKKIALASVMTMSMFLGACGGSDDASGDDDKTISVWAMGEEGKQLKELAEKFEEENEDDIKVEVQAIPWESAHDKLLTAVASQDGPDVFQLGTTWVPEFAEAGAMLDLSEHTDDYPEFEPDNYFEGARETMQYDGQQIGIPWYVESRVLYYREDLLEEVGYDEAPATWDELKDASSQLADRSEDDYGLDIDQNDQITPFIFAWQNGYEVSEEEAENGDFNFDGEEFVGAIEYYHSFFDEGISQTSEGEDITKAFEKGTKPMFFSGPWMISVLNDQAPDIEGQWGTAVMPEQEKGTSSIGGANFSIFHNTEKVDESLEFLSYINETETQLEWLEMSNTLPSRTEAWEDPLLQDDPMYATFGRQLEDAQPGPQIEEWDQLTQELLDSIERINVGGADVEEEMANFNEKAEGLLAE
ncbi:sugar ABC transporter substrate-binding protein [Halobacillus andaensis]|uniref:Sugar ABC transporter substrate-binding protein n=1 Tax=Halobacillus andaensis TaxID=1176239 RepID=A0A917F1R5_HALAA|nr:sugar ABC transporter substrate-binding protein [Halobacillus andaensis]MBP2006324.1 multiple sugar transport system substrate-binding protein [Halobacillus andaensis]GGF34265.1 sugar ABC transporter substrate-binding protein [Halobacillus andaensis]